MKAFKSNTNEENKDNNVSLKRMIAIAILPVLVCLSLIFYVYLSDDNPSDQDSETNAVYQENILPKQYDLKAELIKEKTINTKTDKNAAAAAAKPQKSQSKVNQAAQIALLPQPADSSPENKADPSPHVSQDKAPAPFFGYIKLTGVIFSKNNPAKNKAIIKDLLSLRQRIYQLGAVTAYGSKIIEIHDKWIILEKNNVKRKLRVAEKLGYNGLMEDLYSQGYHQISDSEWLITPNKLIKDTENISEILSQLSIHPRLGLGGIEGFEIGEIDPESIVGDLGLEEGDTISAVNGHSITSLSDAYEVYEQIRKDPTINLALNRKEEKINLAYHVISDGPVRYNVAEALKSPSIVDLFKK